MPELPERLIGFASSVRERGVPVTVDQTRCFLDAAALVGPASYYWAGRATLVTAPDQIPVYDAAFRTFWTYGRTSRRAPTAPREESAIVGPGDDGGATAAAEVLSLRASDAELVREKDFAELTDAERAAVERAIRRLRIDPPSRVSRRAVAGRPGTLDVRRMARRSIRTGGVPIERAWHRRARGCRRGVLLVDVSASMSEYSRAYLLLGHALVRALGNDWQVVSFSTRVTAVSRDLRSADPHAALARVADRVATWDDGTRLGDSLRDYLRSSGNRGRVRGAVCVICSDGLDVGDPTVLRAQMRRLSLLAHRIVWVNPLYDEPGYEPIAGGMQAALPFTDRFVGGHNLARLQELTDILATI